MSLDRPAGRRARFGRLVAVFAIVFVAGCGSTPSPSPSTTMTPGPAATSTPGASAPPVETSTAGPEPAASEPPPVDQEPTAADRILAALEAGDLDEPTALLYRVYAIFGDPRLPAEYVGGPWEEDGAALDQAATQLDSLPSEVATELQPYLARPTDPTSVFHGSGGSALRLPTAELAIARPGTATAAVNGTVTCDRGNDWGFLDGTAPFRVWGHCIDPSTQAYIAEIAGMAQILWPKMTALMGPFIPDRDPGHTGPPEADDGRIDIYLVDQCLTRGGRCLWDASTGNARAAAGWSEPYGGNPGSRTSSGFVVVNAGIVGQGVQTMATIAHELFHLLEYTHNREGLIENGRWHWATEAFATWAGWYFVREARSAYIYPRFGGYQGSSYGLQNLSAGNAYLSYLWPFFMEQEKGAGAIQAAWVATEGEVGHAAITSAIDSQLPFGTNYRELAVRAWNQALQPGNAIPKRLQKLDPTLPATAPGGRRLTVAGRLDARPPGTPPRKIPESIESLYSRYAVFLVGDDVGQVTVDFGGLNPLDVLDVDALVKIKDKGWERRKLSTGSTRLCRNLDDDNVEEMILVLSNHDLDPHSFIQGNWTLQSLKEPCIGYKVTIKWTDTFDGVADTMLFNGTIDTFDTEALGEGAYLTGTGTVSGSRAGWKGCNPGLDDVPSGSVAAEFGAQINGQEVTISGWAGFDTVLSGVTSMPFTVPIEGGKGEIKPDAPTGDLCPRTSFGTIEVTKFEKLSPGG